MSPRYDPLAVSRKATWLLILVVVLAVVPYLSALGVGFIYDDRPQIENNPYLRLWPGYARVFSSDVWSLTDVQGDANYYRPLMWVAYNAVYSIAGAAPWAFHLMNLLMHACVSAVVFLLTFELWKDLRIAGTAGILFALHPVHTEPVVWIAALPDLGYALFFLLALYLCVIEYKPASHALIGSAACYAIALLWKESAITFLPCMVLYDVLALRQFRVRRYAVLGAVTLAYLTVRTLVLGGLAPSIAHEGMSVTVQVLTAISHLGTYLEKLVLPVNLSFFYGLHAATAPNLRIVVVLLICALAIWKLRGKLAWSWWWIPLTLLPALAVSRVIVPLAERNLYLASVGFVWLAAVALNQVDFKKAAVLGGALCMGYWTVLSMRLPVWHDELALFEQALQLEPENSSIRLRVSTELGRRGRVDEAVEQLNEVLKQNPAHLEALTSKAALLMAKKDWQGIETTCGTVFKVDPRSAVCRLDVGIAELQQGRREEAWKNFELAYQSNPRMWQALLEQGTMAFDSGDLPLAIEKLQKAAALNQNPQLLTFLGAAYGRAGDTAKAMNAFNQALRLDPSFGPARQALERK